jgi:hypothetical protein
MKGSKPGVIRIVAAGALATLGLVIAPGLAAATTSHPSQRPAVTSVATIVSAKPSAVKVDSTPNRPAAGGAYKVNVGYADSLRPNPVNFPTPWDGSPNVVFEGCTPSCTGWDGGAVELVNTGTTALTVNSVVIDYSSACVYDIWPHTVSLPAGDEMIFTELATGGGNGCTPTQGYMDSSDIGPGGAGYSGNCTESGIIPQVTATVNGTATVYNDTTQVLNTGGVDQASCENPVTKLGPGNESYQWTPIGTTPASGLKIADAPATQSVAPGGSATVTATVTNGSGGALQGVPVKFTVTSGPDAGTTSTITTNTKGKAVFTDSGTKFGIDQVATSVTNPAGTINGNPATVYWQNATLTLTPAAGLPGSTIDFAGSGYADGETVNLYLGTATTPGPLVATTTASGTGTISGSFVVPIPTGGAQITAGVAIGQTSGNQGWSLFTASCTTDWNNSSGGDFNTASNWTGAAVPGANDLACIILPGTFTVTMGTSNTVGGLVVGSGSSASGTATLGLEGNGAFLTLNGGSTIEAGGVLGLDSPNGGSSGIGGAGPLTNGGTLQTTQENGGTRYIRTNVINLAGATTSVGDYDTRVDSSNTFTNSGTFTVSGSGAMAVTGSSAFVDAAGTVTVTPGSLYLGGSTFTQTAGKVTGTVVLNGSTLTDSAGTGGTFVLECGDTLNGTIPAGQTVTVQGNTCGAATTTFGGGGVTNKGTLQLDSTDGNSATITGSPLTNNGTLTSVFDTGGTRYIRVNVTNAATGKVTISDFDTRNDSGTTITNNGTFTISGIGELSVTGSSAFVQGAGKLTVTPDSLYLQSSTFTQTAGTVSGTIVLNNSTLTDTASTGGTFVLECGDTLNGTIPAGQTVTVQGNACGGATTTLGGSGVTNNGTLQLDSTDGNNVVLQGSPLTNNGTFATLEDVGGTRYIRVSVTNSSGATTSIGDFDTRNDSGTTFTNSGTFTISGSGGLSVTGSSTFVQSAGTLTVVPDSLYLQSSTFTQSGGTLSGTIVLNSSTLTDSVGTGGAFILECGDTLNGTIPAGQTVTVQANNCGGATTTLGGTGVTNNGTLQLDSTNGDSALLQGSPLTNNGTFASLNDGGGTRYIRVNVTNATGATTTIASADTRNDGGTTITNDATFTISGVGGLSVTGGGSGFIQAAGTLTVVPDSLYLQSSAFTQSGGTLSGTIVLNGSTLTDSAGSGGTFLLECSNTLTGTIPAGQTVTVQGNACGNAGTTLGGTSVTNNGTLQLDSTNANYALISGSPLVNNGTVADLKDGGGTRYIRVSITNASGATISIADPDSRMDSSTSISNHGSLSVADGANLSLNSGSSITESTGSSLGVTVDAGTGLGYGIIGGSLTLTAKLAVTTVGSPASGSTFTVISSGTVTGTFVTVAPAATYTASYTPTSVIVKHA